VLGILIVHAVMRRLKAGCSEIAYTHLRRPEIDHYRTPHSVLPATPSSLARSTSFFKIQTRRETFKFIEKVSILLKTS